MYRPINQNRDCIMIIDASLQFCTCRQYQTSSSIMEKIALSYILASLKKIPYVH